MRASDRILNAATLVVACCAVVLTVSTLRARGARPDRGAASSDASVTLSDSVWEELRNLGHRIGPPDAASVVVEFADFQCPGCRQFHSTWKAYRNANPGEVALVYRHWPLSYHALAYLAARASECAADQNAFEPYHDILFEKQDSIGVLSFTALATRAGVPDIPAFEHCVASSTPLPAIERDIAAAKAVGGQGTPTLIVNGVKLANIPGPEELRRLFAEKR